MRQNAINAIIRKEFRDQLGDGIIRTIFSIILISTIIGILSGVIIYHQNLDNYHLTQTENWENSQEFQPNLTMVMTPVAEILLIMGALFGIILGFDLVTKEREGNSLKILLSHPIYRDEVINGKAIGTIAILIGICLALFVIVLALFLTGGIIPSSEEMLFLLIIGLGIFLMILSYFSLALFCSTISETSGNALMISLVIFIILSSIMPFIATDEMMSQHFMTVFIGTPPQLPGYNSEVPVIDRFHLKSPDCYNDSFWERKQKDDPYFISQYPERKITDEIWNRYQNGVRPWLANQKQITTIAAMISPSENLRLILRHCGGLVFNQDEKNPLAPGDPRDLIPNFIILIVFPILFIGLAYVKFMRMDIR